MMLSVFRKSCALASLFAFLAISSLLAQPRLEPIWPTPHTGFTSGQGWQSWVQATASGDPKSGLFGCVRSGGYKFHEGIDITPVERDRKGEATDPIYALLGGKVVHISAKPGLSSYGRYVVIEHTVTRPAVYSLYAHLAAIAPGLQVGQTVPKGTIIGTMGRSAGGYAIPRDRAHLHLEIGFRLTNDFQTWYNKKGFGSKNTHGVWNGMNLVAFDPLDFFEKCRAQSFPTMRDYLNTLPVAAIVRVPASYAPDFVKRYPELLTRPLPQKNLAAFEIELTAYGFPVRITPKLAGELVAQGASYSKREVLMADESVLEPYQCRDIIKFVRGKPEIDKGLAQILDLIF